MSVHGPCRGQKRVSDPKKLESQAVVDRTDSHQEVLGPELRFSPGASSDFITAEPSVKLFLGGGGGLE